MIFTCNKYIVLYIVSIYILSWQRIQLQLLQAKSIW